jgi:hypothetical protein
MMRSPPNLINSRIGSGLINLKSASISHTKLQRQQNKTMEKKLIKGLQSPVVVDMK